MTTATPASPHHPDPERGRRPSPVHRHRRIVLAGAAGAAVSAVFMAGVGTGTVVLTGRMESMMSARMGAVGASGPTAGLGVGPGAGLGARDLAGGSTSGLASADPQAWAAEQGLPAGIPPDALAMLYQRFPDGVPPELKDQMHRQLGGGFVAPGAAEGAPATDLEHWARAQGLPGGLPPQALTGLHQQFPQGVPSQLKDRIASRLAG